MLHKFKNYKNATETSKKTSIVYGKGIITDCQVRNWFSKFHFGDLSQRNELKPGGTLDFYQDNF